LRALRLPTTGGHGTVSGVDVSAFQQIVREVVESITTPSHAVYELLRAPREGNPQKAARIALENFAALKQAQERILTLRLDIEEEHRAARTRKNPEPAPFAYRLDVLADLQNTMLWALIGDDSAVTNLSASLDVDFGYLRDRNIESVATAAREINEDPRSFALIADLSTGVAIGDILHFAVTEEPRLSLGLLEIKEGSANRAILDLHDLFDKDSAEFENAVRAFSQRYGEHGMKQLKRFVRQLERADTYHKLIRTGSAPDFLKKDQQRYVHIVPPEESYAPILNEILDDFYEHNRGYAFFPVDHLYFGFFQVDGSGPMRWRLDFQHHIYHDLNGVPWETCCFGDAENKTVFESEFSAYAKIEFEDLRFTLRKPFLRPLPLVGLKPKYVADIYTERLYVWVYVFDEAIPEVLRNAGFDVRMTRRGHASEHDRSMFRIKGEYIDIHSGDKHGTVIRLGARPVMRTVFSLQTLASMVAQLQASKAEFEALNELPKE
jgi:hypothetical protein